jgi:hypothetical protein
MKQYLLAIYQQGGDGSVPPRDVLDKVMREVVGIRNEMKAAGAWIFSGGLQSPGTASVLRTRGGSVQKTDGPYSEAKEYVGGLTIIQVADQEAALAWAQKMVQATGLTIEVRPFQEHHPG